MRWSSRVGDLSPSRPQHPTSYTTRVDVNRGYGGCMIREHAVFNVISGQEVEFERAFQQAKTSIAEADGFRSLRLSRCLEQPSRYLVLVEWDRLEDHTVGFRGSPAYQDWRRLLHDFYDPLPTVEHYEDIAVV